jgi:hypothetical protein
MCHRPTPTLLRRSAQQADLLRSGPLGQAPRKADLVKGAYRPTGGNHIMQQMRRTLPIIGPQFKQNSVRNVKQIGPVSAKITAV